MQSASVKAQDLHGSRLSTEASGEFAIAATKALISSAF
jgi:hypothetical protein